MISLHFVLKNFNLSHGSLSVLDSMPESNLVSSWHLWALLPEKLILFSKKKLAYFLFYKFISIKLFIYILLYFFSIVLLMLWICSNSLSFSPNPSKCVCLLD